MKVYILTEELDGVEVLGVYKYRHLAEEQFRFEDTFGAGLLRIEEYEVID